MKLKLLVLKIWVYLGVRTCELFLRFVAIVRVRVYYVDFFVFFVLRHWRVSQVLTPRQSQRVFSKFASKDTTSFHHRDIYENKVKPNEY